MKEKFSFQNMLLLFFAVAIIYRFTSMTAEKGEHVTQVTSTGNDDGFLNYVLLRPWIDAPHDLSYWHINKHFNSFSELNYNASHMYAGDCNTLGVFSQDNLTIAQTDTLKSIFRQSEQNGLRCILGRSRIELSCLSQRIIYEVENGNNNITTNHGFVYRNNMTGVFGNDGDRTVLHPRVGVNAADWLCDSVYENLQHTDLYYFQYGTDTTNWFLKPVLKIDSLDHLPGDTTPVVAIVVKNYKGDTIANKIIRVRNFGQFNYSGNYINDFYDLDLSIEGKDTVGGLSHGRPGKGESIQNCKVDFKVYWFGQVDVWFDQLIVDDERADRLFNLDTNQNFDKKIRDEVNILKDSVIHFVGEITSSQAHATIYVKDKITQYCSSAKLQFAVSNNLNLYSHRNPNTGARMLFDIVKPDLMCLDAHVFQMDAGYQIFLPNNLDPGDYDNRVPNSWIASTSTYNDKLQSNAFGNKYDMVTPYQGTFIYQISKYRNDLRNLSANTRFVVQPHLHSWTKTIGNMFEDENAAFREPTNEEIQAQATIAIAHGVQSLNWECYHSEYSNNFNYYEPQTALQDTFYTILGLRNDDSTKRTSNIISQNKWEYVKSMNLKILHWKPTLDKIIWDSGYSVHYETANHNFISDIRSIYRDPSSPFAYNSSNDDGTKYWEMGFFNPDFDNAAVSVHDKSKYFMMVNRRCVPDTPAAPVGTGDIRFLKIKFDSTALNGFRNWILTDVNTGNSITFNIKNQGSGGFLDLGSTSTSLGFFSPGEGKLFKLAPVMQEGGTLVTNENCGGFEFDCNGEVINNGYDVTIKPGTTINFTNTSARINMDGGNFYTGSTLSETSPVYLKGKNGSFWKGLFLDGCSEVEIASTYFENISPYPVDSTYAVQLIDCEYINIISSHFTADLDIKTGGILINYTSELRAKEAYINYNHFQMDAGDMPAVSVTTSGYVTFPLIVEGNMFESYNGNSLNAIFLSGVAGGAIKENYITGYKNGIILLWAEMDIYGNTITGSEDDSKGILCYASSYTNLSPNGYVYTGGLNSISCEGENSACIESNNSFLYLDYGYNTFDLINYDPGNAYHITGSVNEELVYEGALDETLNCFMVSETETTAVHNVTYGFSDPPDPVEFNFEPYYCGDQGSEGMMVFNLGNGNYDSLQMESSGSGGGIRNTNENQLVEVLTIRNMEDSISINLRKRNYERVSELCYTLLTDFVDSLSDISVLSKLYLAEIKLDESGNRISDLKSFFENLILNNPEKESLIKHSFYLIQKCKVSLGLYESAMAGFQEIVNQNPYNYEGLIASWDYAATSLLENSGSSGGYNYHGVDEDNFVDDPTDKYDKKKFTNDNRKNIRKSIQTSFQNGRDKETERIKDLEKKVIDGKATRTEKNELKTKNILKEVIRVKTPNSSFEHVSDVNSDIKKAFGSSTNKSEKEKIELLIPEKYNLSQNYPNPFNPTTKINFDLPHEGKVKLIVYDLLGREIHKLVNNEFRAAGRHMMEFNGNNLSSGVYFYRLEVNDFVQSRRMILIK